MTHLAGNTADNSREGIPTPCVKSSAQVKLLLIDSDAVMPTRRNPTHGTVND